MEIEGVRGIGAVRTERDVWEAAADKLEQIITDRRNNVQGTVSKDNPEDDSKAELKDSTEDSKEMEEQVQMIKDMIKARSIRVKYRSDVKRYAITVVDPDTEEVLREIPSEELLDSFAEMLKYDGLIVDKKG
ncbi:MAG: flagellar protein FlaG [Eubacterium sp.]|nr:flagellar protein FlaG [Eubacterium sp.]